ncbi:unnamed protein product [Prorocentrum cordatum]|uniref:Uncharacterized protein n=1 Tax=Prorocentrum cordatum TaxID=2364126 RepID=A0ABN9S684_9DINO|nr:unnamed protein product [Polarella glacialis]
MGAAFKADGRRVGRVFPRFGSLELFVTVLSSLSVERSAAQAERRWRREEEAADEENEEQTRPRSRGQRGRPGRRAPLRPRLAPRALRGCRGCAQPPRAPPPTRSRACRRAERPRGAPATASPRPGSTYGPPLSQPTRPAASGGSASARAPAASEAAPARPAGAAGPGARRRPGAARLLQRGGESTSLELDTLEAAYSSLVG